MQAKKSIPEIKLSVVVCTFNRRESLRACLASLARCGYEAMEVVVVDGGSTDGTREAVREAGKKLPIKWVEEPRFGLAAARDRGWREAEGEYVAWVDDDVVVSQGWAKNLVKVFAEDETVGGVSGPTIVPERLLGQRAAFFWYRPQGIGKKILARLWVRVVLRNRPFEVGKLFWHGWWSPGSNFPSCRKLTGLQDVDYLEACNMALRRELVARVGGFDLDFRGTSEWCEVDLALRVKRLGYRLVFSSKVGVEHLVSKAGGYARRRQWGHRIKNFVRYQVKRLW